MKNKNKTLIYFLIIITSMLSSCLVLCISDDGTVLLEVNLNDLSNCPNNSQSKASSIYFAQIIDHCDNCYDINLFSEISGITRKVNIMFLEFTKYPSVILKNLIQYSNKEILIYFKNSLVWIHNNPISSVIEKTILLI